LAACSAASFTTKEIDQQIIVQHVIYRIKTASANTSTCRYTSLLSASLQH
jgi:hypothetical protein